MDMNNRFVGGGSGSVPASGLDKNELRKKTQNLEKMFKNYGNNNIPQNLSFSKSFQEKNLDSFNAASSNINQNPMINQNNQVMDNKDKDLKKRL